MTLCPLLVCPACKGQDVNLRESTTGFVCPECQTDFPSFQSGDISIPWLFAAPDTAKLEWKARYNGFLHSNTQEQVRLRRALKSSRLSKSARQRIRRLLDARKAFRQQVNQLLAPLGLDDLNWPADTFELLRNKLPKTQGLSSYSSNIFRDWAWNNGENEALLSALDAVMPVDTRERPGKALTIGAGAGRLSYDFHQSYAPAMSVVLDINPLLVEIASQALQGKTVKLHEFPLAPLNDAAFSKLQQCRAPAPLKNRENYHFVLADGTNLPFASDSFDTVITPWFVDIVPMDLKDLVPMINRNLATGGTWINSGSLAFFHGHAAWCYSEEEVLEIVAENGFDIVSTERRTVPYLHSPLSAHGRMENVLSFAARKVADTEVKDDYSYLPEWILDTSTAVPASDETAVSSSDHLLRAQVLAALDGKRSINDIGKLVARQYALGKSESVHAVRCIVLDAWEERNGAAAELDS